MIPLFFAFSLFFILLFLYIVFYSCYYYSQFRLITFFFCPSSVSPLVFLFVAVFVFVFVFLLVSLSARAQVLTLSTFVNDLFRHRVFVLDQVFQTLTCNCWPKLLDTQQFQIQRKQFTKYNKLKRAAASSLNELAQRHALEKLEVITTQAVETPRNKLEIEVLT